ncbi:MAG: molybdopterin-dependent oxidoreductase, partial [Nitrososphaerales archaeon]
MQESALRTRVPPGQVVTQGYPILHAGSVPNLTKENWSLKIHGEVENELNFNYEELLKLNHAVQTNDIHCVTSWTKLNTVWEGIKFRDLMGFAKPTEKAHY